MMATAFTAPAIFKTRHAALGFCHWGRNDWRFHDMSAADPYKGQLQPIYASKGELLVAIETYAADHGYASEIDTSAAP